MTFSLSRPTWHLASRVVAIGVCLIASARAAPPPPRDAVLLVQGGESKAWPRTDHAGVSTWTTRQSFSNFRLRLEGRAPMPSGPAGKLVLADDVAVALPIRDDGQVELELAYEALPGKRRILRVWKNGAEMERTEYPAIRGASATRVHPGAPITLEAPAGFVVDTAWIQPLDRSDHAAILSQWNEESLHRGQTIYETLCKVCHGTMDEPGSLPTALRFGEGVFKNGSDPHAMWLTLTHGFGQMVAMPQYTTREKYDVIHYIRETFLKTVNRAAWTDVDAEYLTTLPKRMVSVAEEVAQAAVPPWLKMDFGPALMWTYQVAPDNIAYKGIAIRLDEGPGGVSKGRAWMIYDHDTMRLAAAYTGSGFIDWKNIAFDGSHQTHTSIVGQPVFVNPVGPGWADPATGSWAEVRLRGRDGKPYGPLPREWVRYRGLHLHGRHAVLRYDVGTTTVLDAPGLISLAGADVFVRTLNIGATVRPLALRVAPEEPGLAIALRGGTGGSRLVRSDGFTVLHVAPSREEQRFRLYHSTTALPFEAVVAADAASLDLSPLTRGGPARWPEAVTTEIARSDTDGAFSVDTLTLPDLNPWASWMRCGGFDFMPDGRRAAICTWNGDVFIVSGLDLPHGDLTWRRIATGLFQPLGLKVVKGDIYVTCRDQIAVLRDLDGNGEIDFIECFNSDHQVTEHFHEFAMGLQMDAAGNIYYAKSARHALPALVPQHGTLLRVSADGEKTDILATGFRAANGVCLNPDGSFFVTDQEGHWMPKNRINHVRPDGGFFGNMFGYHDVTDPSDAAMRPPLAWITNVKDRSPAELLWVPRDTWGPLAGALLHTSYGTGRLYLVPHEESGGQMQGALIELPLPEFPTGIMRGRFHPRSGDLYVAGMVAWATNRQAPGGFYRVRPTGKPLRVPIALRARHDGIALTFSEPLDVSAASDPKNVSLKTWTLRRTEKYGSQHYDEHIVEIAATRLIDDRTILISPALLEPMMCFRVEYTLKGADGGSVKGSMDGTIHRYAP